MSEANGNRLFLSLFSLFSYSVLSRHQGASMGFKLLGLFRISEPLAICVQPASLRDRDACLGQGPYLANSAAPRQMLHFMRAWACGSGPLRTQSCIQPFWLTDDEL
ncbi:hypothetical protein F5X99DRAFT_14602 [Biscogniauxia marginata]|nr:hypothetical protein F5X99DRAFT_14602 [Biscogniauxia marginata]